MSVLAIQQRFQKRKCAFGIQGFQRKGCCVPGCSRKSSFLPQTSQPVTCAMGKLSPNTVMCILQRPVMGRSSMATWQKHVWIPCKLSNQDQTSSLFPKAHCAPWRLSLFTNIEDLTCSKTKADHVLVQTVHQYAASLSCKSLVGFLQILTLQHQFRAKTRNHLQEIKNLQFNLKKTVQSQGRCSGFPKTLREALNLGPSSVPLPPMAIGPGARLWPPQFRAFTKWEI